MVDFDSFLNWVKNRFNNDVVVSEKEIRINSIFTEDTKHHLWCSPSGGKKKIKNGCYRCFYTDKTGTLVGLVMLVDDCSYEEARSLLSGEPSILELEEKLEKILRGEEDEVIEIKDSKINLPANLIPAQDHKEAKDYLEGRKLPTDKFFYCDYGRYKNRIIIPYYDINGKLIYFNTRSLSTKGLRYLGPDKKIGVGKGDVIYAYNWAKKGEKVYLTEGEFDAVALTICGLNGMACGGKYLNENQISMIKDYKICIALDNDKSGLPATIEIGKNLLLNGLSSTTYVRPPKGIKDWNAFLQKYNENILREYIIQQEKLFDEDELNIILF